MEKQFKKHKSFEMGTGIYKFAGIWSAPSKAILESNPNAYNAEMNGRPKCCHFSCDHCGMPIVNHHMIKDTDGNSYSVGSSCIEKLHDYKLTTASKEAERVRLRDIRREKAQAKREAEREVREEEFQRQRDVNGGLTNFEVSKKNQQEKMDKLKDVRLSIAEPVLSVLRRQNGDFCSSIVKNIINYGDMPYGYAKNIVIEIMTKEFGRKNSKKYDAAYDRQVEIFEEVEKEIKSLN